MLLLTPPISYDFVVQCDQFGRFSRTDPSRFPRTLLGGFVSILFFALAAATISLSIVVRAFAVCFRVC
jgi:hypothetical protein